MAASTVASVHELADELLTKCAAVLTTTGGGTPEFVSLWPGLPALDRQCDTLAVWSSAPSFQVPPGLPPGTLATMRIFISLNALVARCVPTGRTVRVGKRDTYIPPTALELTGAAEKVMEDEWALLNGPISELRAGDLFEGFPCRDVVIVAMTPLDPQGGFAGWSLELQVQLDGYEVVV